MTLFKVLSGDALSQRCTMLSNPFIHGWRIVPTVRHLSQQIGTLAIRLLTNHLQNKPFYSTLAVLTVLYYISSLVKREFYFKFDEELHRNDVQYISKNWVDL